MPEELLTKIKKIAEECAEIIMEKTDSSLEILFVLALLDYSAKIALTIEHLEKEKKDASKQESG